MWAGEAADGGSPAPKAWLNVILNAQVVCPCRAWLLM